MGRKWNTQLNGYSGWNTQSYRYLGKIPVAEFYAGNVQIGESRCQLSCLAWMTSLEPPDCRESFATREALSTLQQAVFINRRIWVENSSRPTANFMLKWSQSVLC